ncbi:MAG TPA: D-2-hydroxyacid dehydrogenase [Rubrobacteraceae bacterium]|nr:D-2-hydroxyacid dehydrogenase [Rubrobacteraceae bacterium]
MTTVVIASYFEDQHVRRIREVDDRTRVLYREDLVPPPRWDGDHRGVDGWERTPEQDKEFLAMLAEAEVLLDFPRGHGRELREVAPKLRWLQGSMAGAGEPARRAGLISSDVVVTTAGGVYSGPLAEFVMLALLSRVKDFDRLRSDQRERRWGERHVQTLEGATLCIVGMGSIGRAIARRARPFGMRVLGVKRAVREDDPAREDADRLYETAGMREALAEADYVAVTLPHTPETNRLLDADAIAAMKPGAYFVNVGRGKVVDERALVRALQSGHLSGAALDVFEEEPLPPKSPLWEMENVIVSPHSTDNVPGLTNRLLTDLFCKNLRRYLAGEPLVNELDHRLLY